jgi:hypothetical protein
MFTSLHI